MSLSTRKGNRVETPKYVTFTPGSIETNRRKVAAVNTVVKNVLTFVLIVVVLAISLSFCMDQAEKDPEFVGSPAYDKRMHDYTDGFNK
jgi:hypothetical protein